MMSKQKKSKIIVTSLRVDRELWKKAKIHAIERGETVTDIIIRLLKKELGEN